MDCQRVPLSLTVAGKSPTLALLDDAGIVPRKEIT